MVKKYLKNTKKLKLKLLYTTALAILAISCGEDIRSKLTSENKKELFWINNHDTVPVSVSYINDPGLVNRNFNVTPMLESTMYEAWVGALKLLKTPISQLESRGTSNLANLELKNILLVEKKRLEIDAGGQLTSAPQNNATTANSNSNKFSGNLSSSISSNSGNNNNSNNNSNKNNNKNKDNKKVDTSSLFTPPSSGTKPLEVTNQNGVNIKLFLQGLTSEFNTIVKFVDLNSGRRLDIPLKDSFSYWKMGFGTDSTANLDASSIVSMFLKLPPAVAGALGTFLQKIGTLNFFVKLKSTQHWIDADADKVFVRGLGKVSKLSYLIAKDVFSKVCLHEGFSKQECETKIYKWSKNPVTDQIKSYAVMPVVGCSKQFRNENTIPLYDHFVIAPTMDEEEIDFFSIDPNREVLMLNIYRELTDREWIKTQGFVAAKYGTYVKKASPSLCSLSEEEQKTKRCMRIKFGSHYYENKCDQIQAGTKRDIGYSFYSNQRVFLDK
jgi:hypothetical protein